jgi:hypothetical protein
MITNDRVHTCSCKVKGLCHAFTVSTKAPYIILVDKNRAHLLRDTGWSATKAKRPIAVATSSAPGIKQGAALHRLILRVKPGRYVWAISHNFLDARRANLRSVSMADMRIMTSARRSTQAVGVSRTVPIRTFKELHRPFQTHVWIKTTKLYLGSHETLEEAAAAYDAAAMRVHGKGAVTNQMLGLLNPELAKTKACKRAAKMARRIVREHYSGELAKRYQALLKTKTHAERVAIFAGLREVGKPTPAPRVVTA